MDFFFLLFIAIDTPNQLNPMQSCLITIIVFVIWNSFKSSSCAGYWNDTSTITVIDSAVLAVFILLLVI